MQFFWASTPQISKGFEEALKFIILAWDLVFLYSKIMYLGLTQKAWILTQCPVISKASYSIYMPPTKKKTFVVLYAWCVHICACTHTCVFMRGHLCISVYTCVCLCICMHSCVHVQVVALRLIANFGCSGWSFTKFGLSIKKIFLQKCSTSAF